MTQRELQPYLPFLKMMLAVLQEHPTCRVTIHQHLCAPKKVTYEVSVPPPMVLDDDESLTVILQKR